MMTLIANREINNAFVEKNKICNLFCVESIFVLFLIFLSDSMLFATSGISAFYWIKRLFPLIGSALLFLKIKRIESSILIISFCILISGFINFSDDSFAFYITQIGYILFCAFYCKIISFEKFSSFFIFWMKIIVIISLFGFFFSAVVVKSPLPTFTNNSSNVYKTLFFTNVPVQTSLARRNWGPFWEPGAFQFYINIALLFIVFKKKRFWIFDVLLFIICDFTTMSGASVLPVPFIIFAYIFSLKKDNIIKGIILGTLLTVVVIVFFNSSYFSEIKSKIDFSSDSSTTSMGFRLGSAVANIKAFFENPLFGVSADVQNKIRMETIYSYNGRITTGNTNTITGFFSYYGIIVGSFVIYKLICFTKVFTNNYISRFLIFVALVLASSNENLMQSSLFIILLFLANKNDLIRSKYQ